MSNGQYGGKSPLNGNNPGRRRSTRAQKPNGPSGASGSSLGGEDNGAKSRLADGVRNRSGNSESKNAPNLSNKQGGASSDRGNLSTRGGSKPSGNPGASSNPPSSKTPNNSRASGSQDAGGKDNRKDRPDKDKREGEASKSKQNPDASGNDPKVKGNKNPNDEKSQNDEKNPNESVGDAGETKGAAKKIGNEAKNATANATGVDYSDKGMKDRLEHQAADMAMDATPYLSQFNNARKSLKDFNKAKKDLGGGDDGITDKAEKAMDDGVDKGIKGVKVAAGAGAVSGAGTLGAAGFMMMKMLMMLKGMALAALGKLGGFIGSIFGAMSSFFSGVLGVAGAVGQSIAAGVMAIVVTGTSVFGYGVFQELSNKDDSVLCVPTETKVSKSSQEYIGGGEIEAVRKDNAVKLWSVYSELGGSKEQTAAVLGNLQAESSLDPTAVETIYSEPFAIGSRKQLAIDVDFKVDLISSSYASRFPAIDYVGIGLAQWTNERNRLLITYANANDVNWYDFDTQVRFMLDGDAEYRQDQLTDFLNAEPGNVQSETERFMNTWIGLSSPNSSLGHRQTNATDYMFILERATANTDYADSILSGINVDRSEGNRAAGAYHQDDGCGNPIKTHYGNQAADGTGEVPVGLTLVPWSRETLPDSLKEFAKNPEDAGLAWGNASGWTNGIYPDQCAALSHSYFIQLYPGWNMQGRPTTRPFGDGGVVAEKWAAHYGERVVDYPTAGAVFSDATTSVYGHTGIVQHVFSNGDILVNEQNIRGVSGEGAGLDYSWSWRVIKKDKYEQKNWEFFKPSDAEPQWTTSGV